MLPVSRIDLQVSFHEKDEARRLGARWDAERKVWYVPDGVDPALLSRWLPQPLSPNIRALSWSLASSHRECWRCQKSSRVFAIMLPAGYEALYVADDPADDCWQCGEDATLLSYVRDVPESVAAELRARAPHYRFDVSQMVSSFYWMNHCEHCGAKLGDFETVAEFGAFHGAALQQIAAPFSAYCGGYTQ